MHIAALRKNTPGHPARTLAASLGKLTSLDDSADPRQSVKEPMRSVPAALPGSALTFPVGAETRRLDADGRIKVAWKNPDTVRLSDLLGWQTGSLDAVVVAGWMVLTQPGALAGVAPKRNSVNARFGIDAATGVERISLKTAHVNRLGVGDLRTVLVAPVPATSAVVIVSPVTCLTGAPAHVTALLNPADTACEPSPVASRRHLVVVGGDHNV